MQTDYLIIGQGIAGTLLSRCLLKERKTVLVIDEGNHFSASKACGGIINPVTGKRLVQSWMIERLLPYALEIYRAMEEELNTPLVKECDILEFHATQHLRSVFEDKLTEKSNYLHALREEVSWGQYFRFNYGIGVISPCLVVDSLAMINGWRDQLKNGRLLEEKFCVEELVVEKDHVLYKNIKAKKIIFCDGAAGEHNPYFKMLPWSKDKGEALIASIPGLPENHIYKQGLSIVPKGKGIFWIGATHDWKYTDQSPTPAYREKVQEQLDYWLCLPYVILDHIVALRPANLDRKPFAGLHPLYPSVGILNGMGGKGCSFGPWAATGLARHLVYGDPLLPDTDVKRFSATLSSPL
jgi:glycine/D-amino acid oxidase-like deaminating enzyme